MRNSLYLQAFQANVNGFSWTVVKENIGFFQKENFNVNDVSGEYYETFYVNVILRDKNYESDAEYAFWRGIE